MRFLLYFSILLSFVEFSKTQQSDPTAIRGVSYFSKNTAVREAVSIILVSKCEAILK